MRYRGQLPDGEIEDRERDGGDEGGQDGGSWKLFLCLLVYRVASALVCRTAFVPDEHWQSLEVAHRLVFGGHLTWEWDKALRGYTHPLMFAALYKLLQLFNMDSAWAVAETPKLFQAVLAAASDLYVFKLSQELFGTSTARYALICQLVAWFTFYCAPRTLSNSVETAATPVVLYHWFLAVSGGKNGSRSTWIYLLVAALSVLVRPTGALIWAPLFLLHLMWGRNTLTVFIKAAIVGCVAMVWSVGVDRYCYGKWVLVQYNFLQFNVLQGHSAVFGTHPWHWYLTQGLPAVLFSLTPLTLHGFLLKGKPHPLAKVPFWLGVWLVGVHSMLAHKEFRFIFPVVPISAMYAGRSVLNLLESRARVLVAMLLLVNVPMAAYFSLLHQRGTIAVMDYLRQDLEHNSSVLFLLPCHSTPLNSHLHVHKGGVSLEFLECPPKSVDQFYEDTAEKFYAEPLQWLAIRYHGNQQGKPLPTHLVMFDVLIPVVQEFLSKHHYSEVVQLFHTHFPDNQHVGHYIALYRRRVWSSLSHK